eukprot:SAG31_NODE_661_length_13035_cov_12.057591_18_plen_102_part_00
MGGGGGKAIAERGANSGGCINTPGTVPRPTFRLVRASSGSLLRGSLAGARPAAGMPCCGWLVDLIIKNNNISEAGSETKFRSGRWLLRSVGVPCGVNVSDT